MSVEDFKLYGEWDEKAKTQLVGLLAHCPRGRLLMQLRDNFDDVKGGGRWGLFGGHVEAGEALIDAIQREISEEIGIKFTSSEFEPHIRYMTRRSGHQAFLFRLNVPINSQEIRLGEGAGFALLDRSQIMDIDIVPSVKAAVQAYILSQHFTELNPGFS